MHAVAVLLCATVGGCSAHHRIGSAPCTLRIGTSGDYAPFTMASDGRRAGLDVDLADAFADDIACEIEWVTFDWPELLDGLQKDRFDIALSGVTMRAERALVGIYSRPYARTGVVVLVDRESSFRSLSDLDRSDVEIAVNRGGHLERWARSALKAARLTAVDDNLSLPALLAGGRVHAIVTDTAEAAGWATDTRALGPFTTDYKAALLHPTRPELAGRLDRWLHAAELSGELPRLREKYLREQRNGASRGATMQSFVALARLRLSLMPLVAAAKAGTGKAVTDPAQERRVVDRARAWSTRPTARLERVYRALIALAKQVQHRSTGRAGAVPTLTQLRDAIRNIDRQVVRELDRLAEADRGSPAPGSEAWLRVLEPIADDLPLAVGDLAELAYALATRD